MKLLINASTLSSTGVAQVAVSFIEECRKLNENTYLVFVSEQVASQLVFTEFPKNFTFFKVAVHPRFFFKGYSTRVNLKALEAEFKPDCVFSVFGPSYWTPSAPHLIGYAYGHYVYPDSPLFSIISIKEKVKIFIYKNLHRYFLKKDGNYYVSETEDVTERLIGFLNLKAEQAFTVSNTHSHYFNNFEAGKLLMPIQRENEFRFLSLCSFAKNKNLEILNQVIPILNEYPNDKKIKFVLTIDEKIFQEKFSIIAKNSIINLGRIDISECPQIYFECDALFSPTLLECFSANYPEAMKMDCPILTSDISFANSICNKAALYFNPLNAEDIAVKLLSLVESESLRNKLVEEGNIRLRSFHTSSERAKEYISICKKVSNING